MDIKVRVQVLTFDYFPSIVIHRLSTGPQLKDVKFFPTQGTIPIQINQLKDVCQGIP